MFSLVLVKEALKARIPAYTLFLPVIGAAICFFFVEKESYK